MATAVATKLVPLYDRIVIRRVEEAETTRGGIIIPDCAKDKPQEGEVIAVGKGKRTRRAKSPRCRSRPATASCSASMPAPKSRSTAKSS